LWKWDELLLLTLLFRFYVAAEVAHHVARWVVVNNDENIAAVTHGHARSELRTRMPDELCEVTGDFGEGLRGEIVHGDLGVPGVHCSHSNVLTK
jgi:hypothetical protein